jgi:alpha-galactosidase
LTVDRLKSQLSAAKEVGCEVFVIDAGWYGAGGGNWSEQVGDWREKLDASFHGHMAEFADEVRERGLGFGLWVEPERIGTAAPILTEHPEWFLPSAGKFYYPNLVDEKVYQYILSELCRLIDTYRLVWMKVDFNYELGLDPNSAEYYFYYAAWNRLFTEIRRRHTDVCFEGCAGGGMRLDINSLRKHDCYWMSDNGNPLDILSIYQNTILRASPGRITKWAVLRPATTSYPKVSSPTETLPPSVVTWTSTGRPWEGYITTDLDFAVLSAMPGVLGVSGDIAGLSAKDQAKLSQHVSFFKKWRHLIANSVAYLNAAPLQLWKYEGWTSIQLQDHKDTTSLLFVYRLEDPCMERPFLLKYLLPNRMYRVVDEDATGQPQVFTGRQLMQDGVIVRIDRKNNAKVLVIAACEDA